MLRLRALRRLAAGVAAVALLIAGVPARALAASPSPAAGGGGDPRSSGSGPGLVGDPLLAILVVVAIGAASLVVTLLYVRATRDPRAG